ncbi:peptidoglycan recognition protein [Streptomyces sp. NPDC048182]|uniref:peptidoglycan recognition protein family protein n=1 Tax=Streptomyces sp. NPDC048182 TaxID=3365507 RepID=UPI00371B5ABA
MRGFLASSIGVTSAAVLVLPLAAPGPAAATPAAAPPASGSTQSLPLAPLARDRATAAPGTAPDQGVTPRTVRPFSLVGVVWDDPRTELRGGVQVRTRATGTGAWSGWQDLETHNADHAADPGSAEGASGRVRGATAPLWVGASDGVEVRVRPEPADPAARAAAPPLPAGLRLDLVDPGDETARAVPEAEVLPGQERAKPYVGPRPSIVTRRGWGADEGLREKGFVYTKKVKAAFVHHTATGNGYTCAQSASVIRGIYRYHVKSMGWRDIGYNFLVDKCGKVYEGRAGGVTKPVLGAHTLGFNSDSMGVAVLGTFSSKKPSAAAVRAVARLTAWKVGLYGMNPRGKTYLTSAGGGLYRKGTKVHLNVISGHRDGFATSCPGKRLYAKLATARTKAAKYQGR